MKNKDREGFTLLEALIALAIFSLILAALYSTFFMSHKAVKGLDESMVRLQECRLALDMMRKEISASFYKGNDEKTIFRLEDRDIYGRQTSRITFTSISPLRSGVTGIIYHVGESGGKLVLYKDMTSPFGNKMSYQADIVEDVSEFVIEARHGERWVRTWDSELMKRLPYELRISLKVRIKDRDVLLFDRASPKIT